MRQEIHIDYSDQLKAKDQLIKKYAEAFRSFKTEISNDIKADVDREIETIDSKLKAKAHFYKNIGTAKKVEELATKAVASHLITGAVKGVPKYRNPDNAKYLGLNAGRRVGGEQDDDEAEVDNFDDDQVPTMVEEIAMLHRALRNQRNFMRMKEFVLREKHEREIFNLKQQLTSNQCLWEQLAESEKRESIMKQELLFTQQSLATCEKIIEKMQ